MKFNIRSTLAAEALGISSDSKIWPIILYIPNFQPYIPTKHQKHHANQQQKPQIYSAMYKSYEW